MTARRGRRKQGGDTRADILGAARSLFAGDGYSATTLRAVARKAGVDSALILHHFGSKEALFRSAMDVPIDPAAITAIIGHGDRGALGEQLVPISFASGRMRQRENRSSPCSVRRSPTMLPPILSEPLSPMRWLDALRCSSTNPTRRCAPR